VDGVRSVCFDLPVIQIDGIYMGEDLILLPGSPPDG
jgi:hypothetical protein